MRQRRSGGKTREKQVRGDTDADAGGKKEPVLAEVPPRIQGAAEPALVRVLGRPFTRFG